MKGTMRYAALAAAVTLGSAMVVQAQAVDSTTAPRSRRPSADSTRGDWRGPMAGRRGGMRGGPGMGMRGFDGAPGDFRGPGRPGMRGGRDRALLRGITLSDAQEKALRAVHVKRITALKPLQVEMVSARADAQIARINGDQKALDAATARLDAVREKLQKQMQDRSPANDLRGVLTPEQQKILDKNLEQGARMPAAGPGGRRGMRDGMRGGRGSFGPRGFAPRGGDRGGDRRGFAPRRMESEDSVKPEDEKAPSPATAHDR